MKTFSNMSDPDKVIIISALSSLQLLRSPSKIALKDLQPQLNRIKRDLDMIPPNINVTIRIEELIHAILNELIDPD